MIEILGSSVAALVASERLLSAGVPVRRTPTGRPSPFARRVLPDGRAVEVGMKLLELTYEPLDGMQVPPPFDQFVSGISHRPWIGVINGYVRNLVDVGPEVERRVLRSRRSGIWSDVADPFLSGDPTQIGKLLSPDERVTAIAELERVSGRTFWKRSETYRDAAEIGCGLTVWRELLWPLYNKIAGWADLPPSQHRKVWLPLWAPVSLLDALRGEPSYRPVRPMHFGVADLYEALEAKGRGAAPDAFWQAGGLTFDLCDVDYSGSGSAVGVRVPRPRSVTIGVAWVDDEHPDGVEWLIDADNPVFRRTWRDNVSCVEYAAGANVERWAYDMSLTVLDQCEVRVPLGDVVCDDPRAIGYGNLNDQILQGLAAADRLIREAS